MFGYSRTPMPYDPETVSGRLARDVNRLQYSLTSLVAAGIIFLLIMYLTFIPFVGSEASWEEVPWYCATLGGVVSVSFWFWVLNNIWRHGMLETGPTSGGDES